MRVEKFEDSYVIIVIEHSVFCMMTPKFSSQL